MVHLLVVVYLDKAGQLQDLVQHLQRQVYLVVALLRVQVHLVLNLNNNNQHLVVWEDPLQHLDKRQVLLVATKALL